MDDFEPGLRRALTISNLLGGFGVGLMLLSFVVSRTWTFVPLGVASILIGADFIYSRRFLTLGWGKAALERVRPPTRLRWIIGLALVTAGCWALLAALLQ